MRSPTHHNPFVLSLVVVGLLCFGSCTPSPSDRLNKAAELATQSRFIEAEEILTNLIEEQTGNTSALRLYGEVLVDRGDFRRADSAFRIFNNLGAHTTAEILYHMARIKLGLGQTVESDSLIQLIIDSASARPDNVLLSQAYNIRGLIEFTNGRYDVALLHQIQSLNLGREGASLRCEADAMRQIGVLLWYRGHLDSALQRFYLPALELYRKAGDRIGEATTISNIGLIYGTREDWKTNLQHQLTALDIRRSIGDHKGLVDSYYFLTSFIPRSDHGRAFAYSYLKKGYGLAQRTGYTWGAEIAYRGLRDIAFAATTMAEQESLQDDSLFESSAEAKVNALNRKALILKKLGRWDEAARGYEEVIRILDSLKYRTGMEAILLDYAEVLSILGKHERAEQMALRAVLYTRSINRRQAEVESELMLASIRRAAGRTSDARSMLERLTRSLDSMYINTLSSTHPMFAFEIAAAEAHLTRGRAYAMLVEMLAEAGNAENLFEVMERERLLPFWGERAGGEKSRILSKLVGLIQDYDKGNGSRTEQRSLQTRVGEIYQDLLSQHNALSSSSSHLTLSSPIIPYSTSRRRVVDLKNFQSSLSAHQVYTSFHVSDSTLSVLVVRRNRSEILQQRISVRDVRSVIDVFQETILRGKDNPTDDLWKGPAQFLHALLIHPLVERGLLHNGDHLIISPHRGLHLIPFAALLSQNGTLLVDSITISYALSATQIMRSPDGPLRSPASLLAFAPDDESLPFVREEIAAIPERVFHSVTSLSKADATTGNLFKESSYAGAIHIASHGSVNSLYPLYSTITCSDRNLELHEILKTKFQARFVFLSACETGRTMGSSGKIPDGHDMVSFPRAFITAGAASVISPLWLVEDRSTAELVALFYEELARQTIPNASQQADWSKPNLLALSLNRAQRGFKSQPSKSHPFYWAAFTLTGKP